MQYRFLIPAIGVLGVLVARADDASDAARAAKIAALPAAQTTPVDFERDVQPLLNARCVQCHGAEKHKAGLRLDSSAGLRLGGDSGASVQPGKSLESKLFQLVAGLDKNSKMPPEGEPLSAVQLAMLRGWIEQGAVMPESAAPVAPIKSDHWSFQPVKRPVPPNVGDPGWIKTPLDAFVLSRLEQEGVKPSPAAEKSTLLRRLYLDLIGLPPTIEETDAFLNDTSPYAYEALVNRLLASEHFGERWGRHWLDLARYADSDGYEKDTPRPWAYRYRDWVINAINQDMPYDQFVIKQLAGDLLPNPTTDDLVATGFHRNTLTNKEGGVDQEEFRVAAVVDRTNTTGQVFMGLTVGCAQCHSHKYDPISQREYYQMFAYFNSGIERDVPAPKEEEIALYQREKAKFDAQLAEMDRKIAARATELKASLPAWEAQQDAADIAWTPLDAKTYRTGSGPFLTKQEDGSLYASGVAYETDSYVVEVETHLKDITGFRIETLADERLPNKGPGRSGNGNFVLTGLSVSQSPLPPVAPAENLAKFATASSPDDLEKDGGSTGDAGALDGTIDTFWDEADNQPRYVLQADFSEPRQMSAISIVGYLHHNYSPKTFDIVVDGTVVAHVDEAVYEDNFFVTAFPPTTGKSLQLVITGSYGGSPGVRELGIFDATVDAVKAGRMPVSSVELTQAFADYEQPGFPASGVLDQDGKTGWGVGGADHTSRTIRFQTKDNVSTAEGVKLQFVLNHGYGGQHNIGRFKIYATTDPRLRQQIPDEIRAILQVAPERRPAEKMTQLLTYFGRSTDLAIQTLYTMREASLAVAPKSPDTLAQAIAMNPQPVETHILLRGDFLQKGDLVDTGTPAVLPAIQKRGEKSDRLDFARWVVSSEHPLTARVQVNRIWEKLFGVGLVRTPEDWGTRSEKPTHPELLDWLASEFVAQGWSTKQIIREIVTSATYRQASHLRADMLERDPTNSLLYKQNTFRLEGEITRDVFLQAGGLLNPAVGGPSVRPPLPPGITDLSYASSVTWQTSPGKDIYRRGMYIHFQRTIPFPQLMAFDCPDSNVTAIKRNRSNSPLQALMLLNDPAFVECAQNLAQRAMTCGATDAAERLRWAFKTCLSRMPSEAELKLLTDLLAQQQAFYADKAELAAKIAGPAASAAPTPAEAAAYTIVARTILNVDEFVTRE